MANPSAVDNINLSGPTVEADHARSIHEGKLNELSKEDLERAVALEQYVPGSVAEKKLVRKIDFVLLPVLWLMYVLAWIDRGNIVSPVRFQSQLQLLTLPLVKRKCSRHARANWLV